MPILFVWDEQTELQILHGKSRIWFIPASELIYSIVSPAFV